MKFIYDKKTDKYCHDELEKCDDIFGESKKIGEYPVTENIIKKFNDKWTKDIDNLFREGIQKIFGKEISKNFSAYINSTPYSMDVENGISISASSFNTMIMIACHEANHYMFRRSDFKKKYFSDIDIEDAKEIFTVVNNIYFKNIMEVPDKGWSKFEKDREDFLMKWEGDHKSYE